MTTNTIEIAIDTTDTAMIGNGSWENADSGESVRKFLNQVREEIRRYWPGYEVIIEETNQNAVYITDDRSSVDASDKDFAGIEEDQAAIRDAISDIWSRGDWYVEAK